MKDEGSMRAYLTHHAAIVRYILFVAQTCTLKQDVKGMMLGLTQ